MKTCHVSGNFALLPLVLHINKHLQVCKGETGLCTYECVGEDLVEVRCSKDFGRRWI